MAHTHILWQTDSVQWSHHVEIASEWKLNVWIQNTDYSDIQKNFSSETGPTNLQWAMLFISLGHHFLQKEFTTNYRKNCVDTKISELFVSMSNVYILDSFLMWWCTFDVVLLCWHWDSQFKRRGNICLRSTWLFRPKRHWYFTSPDITALHQQTEPKDRDNGWWGEAWLCP